VVAPSASLHFPYSRPRFGLSIHSSTQSRSPWHPALEKRSLHCTGKETSLVVCLVFASKFKVRASTGSISSSYKTVLPFSRERWSQQHIYSPLDLTVIFLVGIHLPQSGYPRHWFSTAVESRLANGVVTTARPPRENPLTPEASSKLYPAKRISVAPFLAEFRALAAQWIRALPFGLQSSHIPPANRITSPTDTKERRRSLRKTAAALIPDALFGP
jgi:hypothetical protein